MPAFIETQFPIARLSAESYKERKANNGQTLTRLGKWWGRKPLVLVRASILGMLMPASSDAKKDREIFLKILTMDDEGTWQRVKYAGSSVPWRNDDIDISRTAFDALPYAERLRYCERPENVEGPSAGAWEEINAHLGTTANSLTDLVEQLGQRAFGHTPRVGDSFCGSGSIPFEAARIGCEAFGSDLNPVAGLLTWASLNLLGGGKDVQEEVMRLQAEALAAADRQVTAWGIEHNAQGERADAYLYCVEVKPEGCDYFIPLAPSWLIGEKSKVVARWQRLPDSDRLQPEIAVVADAELAAYKEKKGATVVDSRVVDPFDASRT
jgi:adenine-specific DNA methylase